MKHKIIALLVAFMAVLGFTLVGGGVAQASGCRAITVQNSGFSDTSLWVVDNNTGASVTLAPGQQVVGSTVSGAFNPTHYAVGANHNAMDRYRYQGTNGVWSGYTNWLSSSGGTNGWWPSVQSQHCNSIGIQRYEYQVIIDNLAY